MKPKRPLSFRESITENHKAMDFWADMHGKPRTEKLIELAPKRERAAPKPTEGAKEADVLSAVLALLHLHPSVGWCRRMNVGAVEAGDRYIKFGFVGCSDIIGQMKDGRFLAIEVKREKGGKASDAQLKFIYAVQKYGGVAGVAHSVDDALRILEGGK